ncbi:hypothetical protein [Fluviibacter sp.]
MIDLGTTDFYMAVAGLPKEEFESYSMQLFEQWEQHVDQTLCLPDYSLALQIEEGSIKGRSKILAAAGALYLGIGAYGSFVSGLQTIKSQVNELSDFLVERAVAPLNTQRTEANVRKSGGALASIQRLFVSVQRGELTPSEAMSKAEILLGEDGRNCPELLREMGQSFEEVPRYHQQLPLELQISANEPAAENQKPKRKSPSKPAVPPSLQLRVEVWRESKGQSRKVRILSL